MSDLPGISIATLQDHVFRKHKKTIKSSFGW
jgi:hypothetical protein